MSAYFDKVFIQEHISFRLDKFVWARDWLGNFRCPLCGDSQKHLNKKRGFFYRCVESDTMRFKCHNCQECSGWSLGAWLSAYDNQLQQSYNFTKFKEGSEPKQQFQLTPKKAKPTRQTKLIDDGIYTLPEVILSNSTQVSKLSQGHIALDYIRGRKIPESMWERLLYVDNFKEFALSMNTYDNEVAEKAPEDKRIVIPFMNRNGDDFICFQGRSLEPDAYIRYYTIKKEEDSEKIYGLENINPNKTVIVVEGPLDSLFLPNCVATADSNLLKFEKGDIYIPDNQYRNPEINKSIMNIIGSGKKVCLFPKEYDKYKDINDFVLKGGFTIRGLLMLIAQNTFSGLRARQRWAKLKGV